MQLLDSVPSGDEDIVPDPCGRYRKKIIPQINEPVPCIAKILLDYGRLKERLNIEPKIA